MSSTTIELSDEITASLGNLAEKMDRPMQWIVQQAVEEYLQRHKQDAQRWQETHEALASVEAGHTIPGEAVEAWLASWGTDNERDAPTQ